MKKILFYLVIAPICICAIVALTNQKAITSILLNKAINKITANQNLSITFTDASLKIIGFAFKELNITGTFPNLTQATSVSLKDAKITCSFSSLFSANKNCELMGKAFGAELKTHLNLDQNKNILETLFDVKNLNFPEGLLLPSSLTGIPLDLNIPAIKNLNANFNLNSNLPVLFSATKIESDKSVKNLWSLKTDSSFGKISIDGTADFSASSYGVRPEALDLTSILNLSPDGHNFLDSILSLATGKTVSPEQSKIELKISGQNIGGFFLPSISIKD